MKFNQVPFLILTVILLLTQCKKQEETQCTEYFIDTISLTKGQRGILPYSLGNNLTFFSENNDSLTFKFTICSDIFLKSYQYDVQAKTGCRGPYYLYEQYRLYNWNDTFIDVGLATLTPFQGFKFRQEIDFSLALHWLSSNFTPDFHAIFFFSDDSLYVTNPSETGQIYNYFKEIKLGPLVYQNVYELGWAKTTIPSDPYIYSILFACGKGILGIKTNTGILYVVRPNKFRYPN